MCVCVYVCIYNFTHVCVCTYNVICVVVYTLCAVRHIVTMIIQFN